MPVEIIRDPEHAAALLQPARLQMLECLAEPGSASSVARRLNLPRQQVNYHLRELEKHGFVEFQSERRAGNCVERLLKATAASYVISPEALGRLAVPGKLPQDRFSAAYLVSAAAGIIRDLAIAGIRAARAGKRIATLTAETEIRFRSAQDRHAFSEELAQTLAKLTVKYHDATAPGGRSFRVLLGAWPAITRPESETAAATRLE
ncbi:MAG: helix-turn-helix domain-containing protein [Bryobacteraceae bacterium]|nr:helix-turn-helix domain-containing protein [Bryobacteraceae bacterium]